MIQLKKIGFFDEDEMDEAEAVSLLTELKRLGPCFEEEKALAYMKAGSEFLLIAGVFEDVLDSQRPIVGAPHVMTDGVWAWSAELIYYLQNYHIQLPEEFLQHMLNNNWIVPEVLDFQELQL